MQLPVTLQIKPSRSLAAALCLAHAAVAAGVLLIDMAFPLSGLACGLLAGSLAFNLRRHVLQTRFRALTLRADGTMEILGSDGPQVASVDPRTTVFPWLVALLLRIGDTRSALALPPDALDGEGHRQLRLWLRWKASAAEA